MAHLYYHSGGSSLSLFTLRIKILILPHNLMFHKLILRLLLLLVKQKAFAFLLFWFCKLNIFESWIAGQTKQAMWRCHLRIWEIVIGIYPHSLTFYRLNDESIKKRKYTLFAALLCLKTQYWHKYVKMDQHVLLHFEARDCTSEPVPTAPYVMALWLIWFGFWYQWMLCWTSPTWSQY